MAIDGRHPDASNPEDRAERLKERVYVTFTALAVVLALRAHPEEVTPGSATSTLLITVVGTLLAVLTADFVAHLVVHAVLPSPDEVGHWVRVCLNAFGAVVLPLVFMGLAAAGVWSVERALRAASIALVATLGVVAYLAVRRVRVGIMTKVLVLVVVLVLGAMVVGLELLAHG